MEESWKGYPSPKCRLIRLEHGQKRMSHIYSSMNVVWRLDGQKGGLERTILVAMVVIRPGYLEAGLGVK